MIRDYYIAGLVMRLDSDIQIFHEWCSAYECEGRDIDMTVRITMEDSLHEVGECVLDREGIRVTRDGEYTYAYYLSNGAYYGGIAYNDAYFDTRLMLVRGATLEELSTMDIGYMFIGLLFAYRLTYYNGISLHGSAIAYEGKGIIFTAPSGVGKSTQARLWHEVMGDKVQTVNDDKPALRVIDSDIICYGTPFAGKDHLNENISVPLRAIVNVVRDSRDYVERLDRRESVVLLFEETARSTLARQTNINSMSVINEIIERVPIYRLHCTPRVEAVEATFKALGEIL